MLILFTTIFSLQVTSLQFASKDIFKLILNKLNFYQRTYLTQFQLSEGVNSLLLCENLYLFAIFLVSFWYHFSIILVSFWCNFVVIQKGPFWGHIHYALRLSLIHI